MNINLTNIKWQQVTDKTPKFFNACMSIKWIEPQMQQYYESKLCKCPQCFVAAMTTMLASIVRWVAYNHFHQHLIDCSIEFDMSAQEAATLHPKYEQCICNTNASEPQHQRMDLKMRNDFFIAATMQMQQRLKKVQQKTFTQLEKLCIED